jgi:hypothetical protein
VGKIHFFSCIRDRLGEAEVDNFHFQLRRLSVTGRQHDIGRFQVAMDQTVGCRSHQRPRDLDGNFQNQFCFKRTIPAHASLQGFALDQLHCVETAAAIGRSTELINSGDIRMPQSSGGAGFPQKTFAHSV